MNFYRLESQIKESVFAEACTTKTYCVRVYWKESCYEFTLSPDENLSSRRNRCGGDGWGVWRWVWCPCASEWPGGRTRAQAGTVQVFVLMQVNMTIQVCQSDSCTFTTTTTTKNTINTNTNTHITTMAATTVISQPLCISSRNIYKTSNDSPPGENLHVLFHPINHVHVTPKLSINYKNNFPSSKKI